MPTTKTDITPEVAADSFVSWAICSMLAVYKAEDGAIGAQKVFPDFQSQKEAEIKLTINGHELDFIQALKRLHEDYEHLVKAAAIEMVDEKFEQPIRSFEQDLEDLRRKLRATYKLDEHDY